MSPLASQLLVVLPLTVLVVGGLYLWGTLERWLAEARADDEVSVLDDEGVVPIESAPLLGKDAR